MKQPNRQLNTLRQTIYRHHAKRKFSLSYEPHDIVSSCPLKDHPHICSATLDMSLERPPEERWARYYPPLLYRTYQCSEMSDVARIWEEFQIRPHQDFATYLMEDAL